MTAKPVVLRQRAQRDVDEAFGHYLAEAGIAVAITFIDTIEEVLGRVAEHPASGSPRYGRELDLPGLRSWGIREFPYLVFYLERETNIDVWRVLHTAREVSAWLQEPGED